MIKKPKKETKKKTNNKPKEVKTHSEIYVSNKACGVTEWLPPVEKKCVAINTNSWFDIQYHERNDPLPIEKYKLTCPIIPPESYKQQMIGINMRNSNKKPVFLYMEKICLYPNDDQKKILNEWFNASAKMFNKTIHYVRSIIFKNGRLLNLDEVKKKLNFINIRAKLRNAKHYVQKQMDKSIRIPIHILDEAINLAISNYKTCITNLINGHIKKFRVRPWKSTRSRMIIKIEKGFFRDGTIYPDVFPNIESSKPLTDITRTSTLQYDKCTKKYILFVPRHKPQEKVMIDKISAGIDLGARSFATVYSQNSTYAICNTEGQKELKRLHKKIDKINELLKVEDRDYAVFTEKKIGNRVVEKIKTINKQKLRIALRKYNRKVKNKIKDMHYKAAHELVNTFDNIYIGKLSTKKILSRNNKTINDETKRMLRTLSPYQFRQTLKYMGYKHGCIVKEVSEYQTTITCSTCGRLNYIGGDKIHECKYCGMKASRDENSAKTHLKLGIIIKRREDARKEREKKKAELKMKLFQKIADNKKKSNKKSTGSKRSQKKAGSKKIPKKKPNKKAAPINKKKKIIIIDV